MADVASLELVLDLLHCPHCRRALGLQGGSLRCAAGHSFDVARQGYVNLLTGPVKGSHADTAEMLAARERFLTGGHYRPLADRIAELIQDVRPTNVAEIGAGTGYYLGTALDGLPGARGIATDISPAAARRAARSHDRVAAVVADTWHGVPIKDQVLDLIMVVFAPRNPAEFARLLPPGGTLLVAAAGAGHLAEIRQPLGLLEIEADKQQRLNDQLAGPFRLEHAETFSRPMHLTAADLVDLIAMGPNAHHQDDQLARRIEALGPPLTVSCVAEILLFRRLPGDHR